MLFYYRWWRPTLMTIASCSHGSARGIIKAYVFSWRKLDTDCWISTKTTAADWRRSVGPAPRSPSPSSSPSPLIIGHQRPAAAGVWGERGKREERKGRGRRERARGRSDRRATGELRPDAGPAAGCCKVRAHVPTGNASNLVAILMRRRELVYDRVSRLFGEHGRAECVVVWSGLILSRGQSDGRGSDRGRVSISAAGKRERERKMGGTEGSSPLFSDRSAPLLLPLSMTDRKTSPPLCLNAGYVGQAVSVPLLFPMLMWRRRRHFSGILDIDVARPAAKFTPQREFSDSWHDKPSEHE